jgi:2-isopropylmalate synthase
MRRTLIFDTTLRDGEKANGARLSSEEKVRVARQLARLKVDVLEAGFPAASEEQYRTVGEIAKGIKGPVVAALARATNPRDFDIARECLKGAEKPRVHTFVPGSRFYREHFLKKSAAETLELAIAAIGMARKCTDDVEFSIVDAFRADSADIVELARAAVKAGATTINLADTVGCAAPWDVTRLFQELKRSLDDFDSIAFSIHAHNDLGLALANSLAAVAEGAAQVHCTINGMGERAGNTALEEMVAALKVHASSLNVETGVHAEQIAPACRLVQRLSGVGVQSHKPVVGENAFSQEDAVPRLSDAATAPPCEVLDPVAFGLKEGATPLAPGASLEDFARRASHLGYDLTGDALRSCHEAFLHLSSRKRAIYDADLEALISEKSSGKPAPYKLLYLQVSAGSISVPNATVQMEIDGETVQDAGFGQGPVDASFKTILSMAKRRPKLLRYQVNSVAIGADAQGEVSVRLEEDGQVVNGRAVDSDIVLASANALVDGLNKLAHASKGRAISEFTDEESWLPRL